MPGEHLQQLVDAATRTIGQHGAEELLPACAAAIPEDLRAPLFALAVELVFVDGRVAEREKQFVDALQAALAIDEQTAMRMVGVLLIKGTVVDPLLEPVPSAIAGGVIAVVLGRIR